MKAKDVEFIGDNAVLHFADGTDLEISSEIAEKIWYAVEERDIQEFVNSFLDDEEFSETDKANVRMQYISRAKMITKALKNQILEASAAAILLSK